MAELRKLMRSMEAAMGLQELTSAERDIYYAAGELSEQDARITTERLMSHSLVSDISRPTFFRALKSLVSRGLLVHDADHVRGHYAVAKQGD